MHASSNGARIVVVAVSCLALCSLAPRAAAQTTTVNDFTEYTYAVPAGALGSFADYQVTRTFDTSIVSLRLFIVSGRADDIGYVGSRLVTTVPPMCQDVGTVTSEQEVTDQVTINGKTASFLLRAQENCCCVTGWGSATQGDRANARFRWQVTLAGACAVAPLTEVTDPQALSFEQGNTLDTDNLTSAMQTALSCLLREASRSGGSLTVNSAFRPAAYQQHLREVWDRWNELRNSRDPACATLRDQVQQEFQRHHLLLSQRPAASSAHTSGEAFDANWSLPSGVSIDTLADHCHLKRPYANDPVHFIHQ